MKSYPLIILFLIVEFLNAQTNDSPLIRFPSLNSDGTMIAFSYQGDIWVVGSQGGEARRLTVHEAYDYLPQWSPNGQSIVFSSNRYGNDDLFTITPRGQNLKRLTYHSAADYWAYWINDEEIIFNTRRNYAQVERESEFYRVSAHGGTPSRTQDILGYQGMYSPDGRLFAFNMGSCRTSREAYRGPANKEIWVRHEKSDELHKITDFDGQDIAPDWSEGNKLYYLSAHDGRYNIYRQSVKKSGKADGHPEKLTNYKDEGIDYFDVSRSGNAIVFTRAGQLYYQNWDQNTGTVAVNLELTDDFRFDPDEYVSYNSQAGEITISPNGKRIAYTVQGDIFIKENNKERSNSVRPFPHPSREFDVNWLNDSTLIFLSDYDGDYDIYRLEPTDDGDLFDAFEWSAVPIRNTSDEEVSISLSPDKSQLASVTQDGKVHIFDIDTLGQFGAPRLLMNHWDGASEISWSPDSRWIAYSQSDLDFNREIFIRRADGSNQQINVSMHPRYDTRPTWSPDGSKLAFLSQRNNGDTDVWFAWLQKEDWEKSWSDWDDIEASDEDDDDYKADSLTIIDIDDIHERLVQVTNDAGNERDLTISKDGQTFYYSTNGGDRQRYSNNSQFKKVKWNGDDQEVVLSNGNIYGVTWDEDHENMYYLSGRGMINKLNGSSSTNLPFQAKMQVDHRAVRKQIFDEAWRTLRDRFYDPHFHGRDWNALRDQYEDRAINASTNTDFRYVFNQMLGQVDASHMGLSGRGEEETQRVSTGRVGIEVKPHIDGVEVTRIVPNSPADKTKSQLQTGDVIIAVNGQLTAGKNFYQFVNERVNEKIKLTLLTEYGRRDVIIRPQGSLRNLLYDEWVDDRKVLTNQYSNGRLGYIHIRGMNWQSFEAFERELMASGYGKEGIVIDVRYNGGGWTTDMIMAVLNVRQHAYTIPRGAAENLNKEHKQFKNNYPFGERLPLSSWTKPSIALCNESSYSNAEIFSHAYKHLGHGTLVGKPTFGAVISTGGRQLQNGFFVRVPFRAWYVKSTDKSMEWGPAVPDIIVDNSPNYRGENEDAQLQRAVSELLEQIDSK